MAQLERPEVDEIALLARVHLDDAEKAAIQADLCAILDHFAVLASVDTEGVAPMTHAVPMDLPLREDVVEASMTVDDALRATPRRVDDLILVPSIIPGGE